MLRDVIDDFRSIVNDYNTYPSQDTMPREVRARHGILAAKCVREAMRLIVGYDERVFERDIPIERLMLYLKYIRLDVYQELEREGIVFRYVFQDGLLYGRLTDDSAVMAMYPLTTRDQSYEVSLFMDTFELNGATVH